MTRFAERRRIQPDVFMIAYDEANAEENWARLRELFPPAQLVRGVPGIQAAYRACAAAARTPWFFAVDADNHVLDGRIFATARRPGPDEVMIWCARNPINDLAYGHGGIKLFPTHRLRQETPARGIDITTSIAARSRGISELASEHRFNTDPFKTWSGAFRETVKLAADIANGLQVEISQRLLDAWCERGAERPFGRQCIAGARAGRSFGSTHAHDRAALGQINDTGWLKVQFAAEFGPEGDPGCGAGREAADRDGVNTG